MADPRLTEREREVLALVAEGLTRDAIARRCGVTERTVGRRLHRACRALGANGAAHAVHLAWVHGIFERRQVRRQVNRP